MQQGGFNQMNIKLGQTGQTNPQSGQAPSQNPGLPLATAQGNTQMQQLNQRALQQQLIQQQQMVIPLIYY